MSTTASTTASSTSFAPSTVTESAGAGHGAALRVNGVTKRYGGLKVFENLSFELGVGEVLGVIGPNGAGKTTLINVLCGSTGCTGGHITLRGREIGGLPLHEVSCHGLVRTFQQTNTFRSKSVRENLGYALRFSRSDAAQHAHVSEMFERFELAPRLDEMSDKLPYSLQKMLGLLLAFIAKPSVLLMDEPAAGLERREREYIDFFIHKAREALGCSVLIVEHDIDLIRRLCERVIVLDGGRLLAAGETAEVLSRKDVLAAYVGEIEETADADGSQH
ncbi:Branched-chain amino acid transport ATP-binding protein LivG [Candidatus Burkholderia verschuerenii]|uniref:Branched-chain amino acid transport ATP-binding protein LivG n=1 Tax=Candidatus Burkholderia verschuerenii TaxID=242163 RepID=A0A0L0MHF6_9BURK|nr:ATP-binding cassette domain-containing protein [Candidatus Burkholderia verschuerenii]KND62102.1 Branched-chain amino acid transport ATP-binding protein LivG [Candidatus Burkholderia verschuerenii]